MDIKFSLILLLIGLTQNAGAFECVDLSHVETLGGLPLVIKQPDCDHWVRQQYYQGEPLGEPSVISISDKWSVVTVDDEYEKGEVRQLWRWNLNKTAVLHEYIIQNYYKKTKVDSFTTGSESFSVVGEMIQKVGQKLSRREGPSGDVTITSSPVSGLFAKSMDILLPSHGTHEPPSVHE
jgi:hypothetical protein